MTVQTPVVVPVRSAWSSRINQIAVAVFGLAVPLGTLTPFLPEPWKSRALAAVSILGALGIWYYRTFATASVTPSAAASDSTPTPTLTQVMRAGGSSEEKITDALNAAQLSSTSQK